MNKFKPAKNATIYYIMDKEGNVLEKKTYRGTKKFYTTRSAIKNSITCRNGGRKFDWNKFYFDGFYIGEFNISQFEKLPTWLQVAIAEIAAGESVEKILKQYGYVKELSSNVSILDLDKRVTRLEHAANIFGDS